MAFKYQHHQDDLQMLVVITYLKVCRYVMIAIIMQSQFIIVIILYDLYAFVYYVLSVLTHTSSLILHQLSIIHHAFTHHPSSTIT